MNDPRPGIVHDMLSGSLVPLQQGISMRVHDSRHAWLVSLMMAIMFTSVSSGQTRHADHDVTVGDITVRMLQDAQSHLPLSLLAGIDHAEAAKLSGGADSSWTPANAYLVRMPGHTVLVNAGMGNYQGEGFVPKPVHVDRVRTGGGV